MQLCKNFGKKRLDRRLTPSFLRADWAPEPLFLSAAQLRLSATTGYPQKMTIYTVFLSTFSDLTSKIANPSARPRDSNPVGYIFYFFQVLDICVIQEEYCSPLAFGQDVF